MEKNNMHICWICAVAKQFYGAVFITSTVLTVIHVYFAIIKVEVFFLLLQKK